MNLFARILSHGFALVVVALLAIGLVYRGDLFPGLKLPAFLTFETGAGEGKSVTQTGSVPQQAPHESILEPPPELPRAGITVESKEAEPAAGSNGSASAPVAENSAPVVNTPAEATATGAADTGVSQPVDRSLPAGNATTEYQTSESAGEQTPAPPEAISPAPEAGMAIQGSPAGATATTAGESVQRETAGSESALPIPAPPAATESAPPVSPSPETAGSGSTPPVSAPTTASSVAEPVTVSPGTATGQPESAGSEEKTNSQQQEPVTEVPSPAAPVAGNTVTEQPESAVPASAETKSAADSPYQVLEAAREAYWLRDYATAEKKYNDLIAMDPNNPDGYGELGNMYFSQGEWDKASAQYYEAGIRLLKQGLTNEAGQLVEVIRGLNGSQADALEQKIKDTSSTP